ncbi:MAG: hypothetical protein FJZ64_04715, partial [Chlamydiae bacterium]|nr:hypothetical protein [Chlamydiota bacterium]
MSSPVLETLDLVKNTLLLLQEEELLCTFSNRMKEPVLKKHEIPPSIVKVPLSPQIEIPIPPVQKEKILSPMPPIIATPLPSP